MAFVDALRDVTGALGMTFAPEQAMKLKAMEEQKRQNAIAQLTEGVQAGAIDPTQGNVAIQRLGGSPTGPSAITQERMQQIQDRQIAAQREQQLREGMAPILSDLQAGKITPEQAQYKAIQLQSESGKAGEAVSSLSKPQTRLVQDAQGRFIEVQTPSVGAPITRETEVKGAPKSTGGKYGSFWTAPSTLPAKTIRSLADQAEAGDTTWRTRLAPGDVRAVQNMIAEDEGKGKLTPKELLASQKELGGLGAEQRALGTRSGQIRIAANEAMKMSGLVLSNMEAVGPTNFIPANKAINAYNKQTGDPKIQAYGASINAFINSYSRAISPTGTPTVADKEHARDLLDKADSPAQVRAVVNTLRQEMAASLAAPQEARKQVREDISGKQPSTSGWSARIVQ